MIDLMGPFRRRDIYHWRMVGEISDPAELARLRKALLEYCRQDTPGLVRLLEKMRSIQ
jgi:hypothetical protein